MRLKSSSPPSDCDRESERFDGIDRYYVSIGKFDRFAGMLFWGAAALSVASLFAADIPWAFAREIPAVLYAISVAANLLVTLFLRFHLIPVAEQKRRKQLLSDAFGVPLTPEETRLYYNNTFDASLPRLGANVMENAFFGKHVCGEMAKSERDLPPV